MKGMGKLEGRAWMWEGWTVLWGLRKTRGSLELGVMQHERLCGHSQSLALLYGLLDSWDFPLWPLGISAQSPAFQPAPAPFPLSLDSAGPQPCIPPTPPALGWGEVGITD